MVTLSGLIIKIILLRNVRYKHQTNLLMTTNLELTLICRIIPWSTGLEVKSSLLVVPWRPHTPAYFKYHAVPKDGT